MMRGMRWYLATFIAYMLISGIVPTHNLLIVRAATVDEVAAYQPGIQASIVNATTSSAWLKTGTYRMQLPEFQYPKYNSVPWNLVIEGSSITGTSVWVCCPGNRTDPLVGSINGDQITIDRDCTGQGFVGPCSQVYTGTIENDKVTGQVTGTGVISTPWVLYKGPSQVYLPVTRS